MREKFSRRDFFRATAGLAALAPPLAGLGTPVVVDWPAYAKATAGKRVAGPIFLATWEHGKPTCEKAAEVLLAGGSLLEAVEKGVNTAELDPLVLSVGYGALPNADGELELDAAIMDGPTHTAAAVAGLKMIATPISVARRVLEKTTHTLLAGEGALRFAIAEGFNPAQLLTPEALKRWHEWRANPHRRQYWRTSARQRSTTKDTEPPGSRLGENPSGHLEAGSEDTHSMPVGEAAADTITLVACDTCGNLAAGGSTSGLAWKLPGRVGDVSLIGCGIYVDNDVGAAGATGNGDEMIKFCTSLSIVERMRAGMSPQEACEDVLRWMLRKNPANRDTQACVYALS
ncbi:MAG: N(4)-(beta-N-acetylglucosaminyl)-L-asparaginase, partial [Terriglobia bacterium]